MEQLKGFVAALIAITFTICFIAVLHYSSFERHHSHKYPTEHREQEDSQASQVNPPIKTSIVFPSGVTAPIPANAGQRIYQNTHNPSLQNADHYAQLVIAVIAFFGFIVGCFGLYFLWRTVEYTRAASDAAGESLNVARNASKAEFQPYISIGDMNVSKAEIDEVWHYTGQPSGKNWEWDDDADSFLIEKDGEISTSATVFIENYGKTPAFNLFIRANATLYGTCSDESGNKIEYKFSPVKTSKKFLDMLEPRSSSNEKTKILLKLTFNAISPKGGIVLRTTDNFALKMTVFVSFIDSTSDKKRRVYFAQYMSNLKTCVLIKDRYGECGPSKEDSPPKDGFGSIVGVQTSNYQVPPS